MRYQGEHKDREISPRTKKNFWYASARQFQVGNTFYYVNVHTDKFRLLPEYHAEKTVWWEFGDPANVWYVKIYWLWFGMAKVTPL